MATSGIFHSVLINDPKKAEAFISAIGASIADPYKPEGKPKTMLETDPNKIKHIIDMRKKEAAL